MKKIFGLLLLVVTAFAVGCSRENNVPEEKPVLKMKVTMCADNSKTAMVPVPGEDNKFSPIWTAGDKLGVFVRANAEYVDQNIATEPLSANTASATFTASVTAPEEDATYEFYTYYPYNAIEGSNYDKVKVVIPAEQNPANSSFDPKADILSGYPIDVNVTAKQKILDELNLQFIRKSSIVRFLIPSCSGFDGIDGNTPVSEVKVYFDQNVVGTATWDIRNSADLALDVEGASNLVTLKYTETHKITDPLWLSIAPVSGVKSLTFAFKVADNAYLYASANLGSAGASFEAGGMKKYNIPISATKWELKSFQKKYVKVTSAPDSWYGKYLIVGANGDPETLYACDQQSIGSWGSCSEVTAETDGSILGTADVNNYAFDVVPGTATGTYAFKFTSGDYSGQFVSSGAEKKFNAESTADSEKTDFTLTVEDDYVKVKANTSETRQLRYNYNSGSGGLRFYDGTTANPVSLYKQVDDYSVIVPVIANPVGIPEEVAKEGVVDAQFTCDIANLGKNSVSIESADGDVVTAASVSYNSGTATVTYTVAENTGADRNGWIVLKAGTTERQIDIHQATGIQLPVITDVDDQNITYEASTERSFDVTIDNVGSFEVSCTFDGTVVTAATPALKEGNVYTITYTVTENTGETQRNGTITVKCSTISTIVNIIQGVNSSLIKTFTLTNLSDITPDDIVVLIGNNSYAMTNDNGTTSAPTAIDLSSKISGTTLSGIINDNCCWKISGNATDGYTFYHAGDNTKWLYCNTEASSSSNNNMRVGKGDRKLFVLSDSHIETKDSHTKRYLSLYNSADWRGYTNTDLAPIMTFYVLDDGKTKPTITTTPKSITTLGSQDVSEMFSSDSDGTKSYSVSGGTLSGTTFTASEAGSYTVTMTQEATATYKAAQAQATITVEVAPTLNTPEILTEGDNNNKKITVTWSDVDNATSYTVHCNSATHDVSSGVELYEITGLEYGVQYDIYVSASADGYYPSNSEHELVTLTDPAVQTLDSPVVTTSVSGTTVTVNWVDVANATSYYVECGAQNQTVNSGVQTADFTCTAGQYDVKVTAKATGYNDGVSETSQVKVYEKLATPSGLDAPSASITSSSIKLTWTAVSHADAGYQVSNGGTNWTDVAAGTTEYTFTSLDASTEYTLYVRAKDSGYYTVSDAASKTVTTGGASKTYHHTFSAKPNTGNNVTLSNMNWNITATALNAYNSGYAGVQFGTSKATGDITLTSSAAWSYQSTTKVKEIRVWLNTGGGTITPTVTIGGTSVPSDGTTVSKKSSLNGDYTKANKVTFKPSSSMTGVIIISVAKTPASGGAGYICAIEVDSE